jgi:thermostable 8-oxoguanine DNA glycosylase
MLIQLNFLGNYLNDTTEEQLNLLDEKLQPVDLKDLRKPKYRDVEKFFESLDLKTRDEYIDYWERVKPKNSSGVFQRWLFAFMSVHTSWKTNVTGYNAIKDWWRWVNKEDDLKERIQKSGAGMHNNRTKYITEFAKDFWENIDSFEKASDESWTDYRNRLQKRILGLGPAKTSFSLELCFPNEAYVACMDTHLFQVYGLDQAKDLRKYEEIESHWLDMSRMWNIPPYIARCIYWDKKQNKTDSRYWSYVLE